MGSFITLIESLAPGIYVIAGILLLWNLRLIGIARGEIRFAQYGLEKELAQRRGGRAITIGFVMVELIIGAWAISTLAAPAWSDGLPDRTETRIVGDFLTSTPVGGGELGIDVNARPTAADAILATAPPPSTPVGTISQNSDPRRGCDPDTAWIQIPGNGQIIFEELDIIGTANVLNFSKYRFEIRSISSDQFNLYTEGQVDYINPVQDNVLGRLLPAPLLTGEYRFRLTVFDASENLTGLCEITIFIERPPVTETPQGGGTGLQ